MRGRQLNNANSDVNQEANNDQSEMNDDNHILKCIPDKDLCYYYKSATELLFQDLNELQTGLNQLQNLVFLNLTNLYQKSWKLSNEELQKNYQQLTSILESIVKFNTTCLLSTESYKIVHAFLKSNSNLNSTGIEALKQEETKILNTLQNARMAGHNIFDSYNNFLEEQLQVLKNNVVACKEITNYLEKLNTIPNPRKPSQPVFEGEDTIVFDLGDKLKEKYAGSSPRLFTTKKETNPTNDEITIENIKSAHQCSR